MAEVRLEHLYKTYKGGVEAVKDLNLTIHNGEFLALLGPSGCGKSSTLRMIVGLEDITGGSIYIGDRLVNKLEPNERNVALAFETYALYPPMTVRDNISFCLRARAVPPAEIRRRVVEVAEMLDITDIMDRKPAELGGGQKQRVSLARALVRDPAVFLLDEPLSHLDAGQRAHMRAELKRLHAAVQRTMILVTHDQIEAIAMAERIAVMNLGVLQQVGTFEEVYHSPANEFVAGFIGEPPMNILACTPVQQGEELLLVGGDGSFKVKLPPAARARVLEKNVSALHLGVRPTEVRLVSQPAADGVGEIRGTVITYESLGEEGQLNMRVNGANALAVVPPFQHLRTGDPVALQMRSDRIHLFDATTGVAL
jgi:multiple sugar transport system ATP-binding protein